MVVTLQQLRYFLAAVERGSVSAAAEACFVSQPSLSDQLRRLEQGLGVALFVRTNRGLVLTDAGRLLVPRAERAVAAARDAEEAVREAGAIVSGTVAFGTFSTAHHHVMTAAIAAFRQRYPGVRLRVISRNSTETADAVRRGDLEAALVALPVDGRGLVVGERVWTTEAVYVTADRGRLRGEPRSIQQLAAAQLVLPEVFSGDADPTRRQLRERADDAGVRLAPVAEVESPEAALDLVLSGVGDSVVSLALIRELGLTDRLAWVSLEPPLHERYAFITRRGAPPSKAMAALIAIVEEQLRLDPV
ncbi:LysR family transcriptional regulator [Solirubrobacter phytolaccae]|uniref:LysR family transcriptional regulator n=1 Tax=Solirubrobacter phytolaccae TaxID=1404360 RepID=A0A9X3SDT2_9ACTN|nr:LysR family transcriptional regulator [Solirubrobacter phytolaccae]MDA0179852.1 LysR family transcriptional regulator [Solirubrobacter phytolaccae]